MQTYQLRRIALLIARLEEFRKEGADSVSFGALLGDDHSWTIGQEIARVADLDEIKQGAA